VKASRRPSGDQATRSRKKRLTSPIPRSRRRPVPESPTRTILMAPEGAQTASSATGRAGGSAGAPTSSVTASPSHEARRAARSGTSPSRRLQARTRPLSALGRDPDRAAHDSDDGASSRARWTIPYPQTAVRGPPCRHWTPSRRAAGLSATAATRCPWRAAARATAARASRPRRAARDRPTRWRRSADRPTVPRSSARASIGRLTPGPALRRADDCVQRLGVGVLVAEPSNQHSSTVDAGPRLRIGRSHAGPNRRSAVRRRSWCG
jgi:hypothetical protein